MKFIVARHCETDWNVQQRVQGSKDVPLNEHGKIQAGVLAEELANRKPKISMIVSSHLKRAIETAEIIGYHLGVPVHVDSRLRECDHGVFEGLTKIEGMEKYGVGAVKTLFAPKYLPYDFGPYGGESTDVVAQRHLDLLDQLAVAHPRDQILLIGHSRGLNTLLAVLDYETDLRREEYRLIEYPR